MLNKTTTVEKIKFTFKPVCEVCGFTATSVDNITIVDIISAGTPICQECGDDLELLDKCTIVN
jgi:tRNA(Ile2) C34 agmatinyltransferase TiaS